MQLAPPDSLNTVIQIEKWKRSEDFPYHPIGSKPKRVVVCPDIAPHPGLIPGHAYLFKVAHGYQRNQMWAEAIAYHIAGHAGLDVPACFIGHDADVDQFGALIEFFYGYPGQTEPERLVHGADLLQRNGFMAGGDRPHGVATNIKATAALGILETVEWWAKLFAFDALIGNVDRHTENWGVLYGGNNAVRMAPIFDNGSSLGHIIRDEDLAKNSRVGFDRFIRAGHHHCGWSPDEDRKTPHVELCRRYAAAYPGSSAGMQFVIHRAATGVQAAVEACVKLRVNPIFTIERSHFVLGLVERRVQLLTDAVRG